MSLRAVEHFHSLLESMDAGELEDMKDKFLADLTLQKASYGGRLLTRYLRPKFLTVAQMQYIRQVCTVLRNVVVKVKNAYFENSDVRADIALTDRERELAAIDPGFDRICVTSRWDSFWSESGLNFVELNAESPAGMAYTDIMNQIYFDLPVMHQFSKRYKVEPFHLREVLLHAMLVTYMSWSGVKSNRVVPNIAIVDWEGVPTYNEFALLKQYFEFHGLRTIIADPRELEYRNGRLVKGDFEIDLLYRRVLIQEFVEKLDEVQPMLQAYADQRVCMINSLRTKIVHKKSVFAILSDTRNAGYFSASERQVIDEVIPWTRVLRDCKTDFHGKQIDLVEFTGRTKADLVIKPNDDYGGRGVVIGSEVSQEQWDAALTGALEQVSVVQEKVPLAWEQFPYYDGGLKYDNLLVDLDPYLFGINMGGCLTRLSTSSLANVTAGGGATVTFIVDELQK